MRDPRVALRERPPLTGVLLVTVLGLVARFWELGFRTAHQDEARVGLRTIEFFNTGDWFYRPIVHGPFLFHVNRFTFDMFGANDFVARGVVALVGGLFPLAALLLRDRLDDVELVALATLLAANPVLLYYSRFMRNDVLLAAFAFTALAFAIRAIDRSDPRYLHGAAVSLALAFTTKENALLYLVAWAGALALLADYRIRLRVAATRSAGAHPLASVRSGARRLWAWKGTVALILVEMLAVIVFFYADRPEFSSAITDPTRYPDLIGDATIGSWNAFYGFWVAGGREHAYLPFFRDYVETIAAGALVLVALAALGVVADRYAGDGDRPLVSFATYWGLASLVGYPLATDIMAPWNTVHTLVPLAIPAAVGAGFLLRRGRRALAADDRVGVALVAIVLLVAGGQMAWTAVGFAYLHPQDPNPMTQYGQPDDDHKPMLERIEGVVDANAEGPDVVFYGSHFRTQLYRQPYPWYLAGMQASTEHTTRAGRLEADPPPVVIAPSSGSAGVSDTADSIDETLSEYWRSEPLAIVLELPGNEVRVTVFIHPDYLDAAGLSGTASARDVPPAPTAAVPAGARSTWGPGQLSGSPGPSG